MDQNNLMQQLIRISSNIALPVAVLSIIGYYIDKRFESQPIAVIIGVILGFIVAIYNVWRDLKSKKFN